MAPKAAKELIAARRQRAVKKTATVAATIKSKYSAEICKEGHEILARADSRPALQVWIEFKAFMKRNHVSYVAHRVPPSAMLVHPDNRDGAMVNAHDVHSNLKQIREITADKDEVRNAWATEMPTDHDDLKDALADNDCIIDCSGGLLAARNGSERFLTFGCSHTGQGFKAVESGCKTSEPDLADTGGRLSADVFCKLPAAHGGGESEAMRDLLAGWDINVIPSDAVNEWPDCVSVGSKALNISQTIPKSPSEIQTLLALTECVARGLDDADSIKRVLSSNPSCKGYIRDVFASAHHVKDLPDALHRLTRFAGMHSGSKVCGQEVFKTIHAVKAFDRNEYNMMRMLILYQRLVSNKSFNSACVGRAWNDEQTFPLFMAAAEAVDSATKYVDMLQHKSIFDDSQAIDVLGRFYVRVQLLITHAEGTAFEKTMFKSICAIQKQLSVECNTIGGRKLPSPPWKSLMESMAAADAADATAQDAPIAMETTLNGEGFAVGVNVIEKVQGSSVTFKIKAISDNAVTITKNIPHRCVASAEFSLEVAEFLRNFQAFGQKVHCEWTGVDNVAWTKSLRGAAVMRSLAELMISNKHADFIFTTDGVVRVAREFKIGELTLYPTGMQFSFEKEANVTDHVITCVAATQTEYIRVHEPLAITDTARKTATFPASYVLNPYWWVKATRSDGNMKFVSHSEPCADMAMSVNVLVNHRALTKGEVLGRSTAKSDYLTAATQVPKAAVKAASAKVERAVAASSAAAPRDKKPKRNA
jgi:hypothetical protein